MKINYELYGRCFWHEDCSQARPGIMKVIRNEKERSLLECLYCGRRGYYPVGGVGQLCVEEMPEAAPYPYPKFNPVTGEGHSEEL